MLIGKGVLAVGLYIFVAIVFRAIFAELAARRGAAEGSEVASSWERAETEPVAAVTGDEGERAAPARRPSRPDRPCLVVERSPDPAELAPGTRIKISAECTLGRDLGNDVVLPDRYATGHHATILRANGICHIRDRGSTNGTYVNGVRVDADHALADGDRLTLGNTELRYIE